VAYDIATGCGLLRPLPAVRGTHRSAGQHQAALARDPLIAATGDKDGGVALVHVVDKLPSSGYWEYLIGAAALDLTAYCRPGGAAVFNWAASCRA